MGQVDVSSALAPGLDEGLVCFPRHGEVVPRKDGADRGVGILGGLVWIGFQAEELTSDVFTRSQYQSLYRAVQNLVSVVNKQRGNQQLTAYVLAIFVCQVRSDECCAEAVRRKPSDSKTPPA